MLNYDLASTSRGHGPTNVKKQSQKNSLRFEDKENIYDDICNKESSNKKIIEKSEDPFERTSPLRKNKEEFQIPIKYMKPASSEVNTPKIRIIRNFLKILTENTIFDEAFINSNLFEIKQNHGSYHENICKYIHKHIRKELLQKSIRSNSSEEKLIKSNQNNPNLSNLTAALDKFINGIEDIQTELDDLKSKC